MSTEHDGLISADDSNGNAIFIHEADRNGNYQCPECKTKVIPVMGNVYRWHFRHESKTNCKGGETQLHYHAKYLLLKMKKISLPCKTYRGKVLFNSTILEFHTPIVEPTKKQRDNSTYKPDLIATLDDGSRIWIEVTVTSKTEGSKLQSLKDKGIFAIEFDLSNVDRITSADRLRSILSGSSKVNYLSHPLTIEKQSNIDLIISQERHKREANSLVIISDMNRRQHEYQQLIKNGTISDKQARHNHNEWIKRADKKGLSYLSFEQFIKKDFTK